MTKQNLKDSLSNGRVRKRVNSIFILLCINFLVAGCIPWFTIAPSKKDVEDAKRDVEILARKLETFKANNNRYPYHDELFGSLFGDDTYKVEPIFDDEMTASHPAHAYYSLFGSTIQKIYFSDAYTKSPQLLFGISRTHLTCIVLDIEVGCPIYIYMYIYDLHTKSWKRIKSKT